MLRIVVRGMVMLTMCLWFAMFAPMPVQAATDPKLGGGFTVPSFHLGFTQERWAHEFRLMKGIGMKTVIMRHAANYDTGIAYYPTQIAGLKSQPTAETDFANMMAAADAEGMDIHLGLVLDEDTWFAWNWPGTPSYPEELVTTSTAMVSELLALYGKHPSLKGIYIPQEIDNVRFQKETVRTILTTRVLQPISEYIATKRPDLLVSCAPFFNPLYQSAGGWQTWWTKVLTECPELDIVIQQDGIGANGKMTFENVADYFAALCAACDATGRQCWDDLEMFESTSSWEPPPTDRVLRQLKTAAPYVRHFVCWVWQYCSPHYSMRSLNFYCDYQRYINNLPGWYVLESGGKSYSFNQQPRNEYPDPEKTKLTDGESSRDFGSGKMVGWWPTTNKTLEITLDLGVIRSNLCDFRIHMIKDIGAAVPELASVRVTISADGNNFIDLGTMDNFGTDNPSIVNYRLVPDRPNSVSARFIRYSMPTKQWCICTEMAVFSIDPHASVANWEIY